MADRRKLQGEIDRCLKKVTEGVETFDDIWKKVHGASNTNQKEKYEADLKKEIKKLQRLRDQIKTWLSSSEIKDKRQLQDTRKLIETQMERFKVVERETKTKAYSKEGLSGGVQKIDPAQKEKDDTNQWLANCIDSLNIQVDQFECEMESMSVTTKKGKNVSVKDASRVEELKAHVEKHRFHINKLETLMRMLDNGTIEVDKIRSVQEDVNFYLESCLEPDFEENEYLYDDLDLDESCAPLGVGEIKSTSQSNATSEHGSDSPHNELSTPHTPQSVSHTPHPGQPTTVPTPVTSQATSSLTNATSQLNNHHSNAKNDTPSQAGTPNNLTPSSPTSTPVLDIKQSVPSTPVVKPVAVRPVGSTKSPQTSGASSPAPSLHGEASKIAYSSVVATPAPVTQQQLHQQPIALQQPAQVVLPPQQPVQKQQVQQPQQPQQSAQQSLQQQLQPPPPQQQSQQSSQPQQILQPPVQLNGGVSPSPNQAQTQQMQVVNGPSQHTSSPTKQPQADGHVLSNNVDGSPVMMIMNSLNQADMVPQASVPITNGVCEVETPQKLVAPPQLQQQQQQQQQLQQQQRQLQQQQLQQLQQQQQQQQQGSQGTSQGQQMPVGEEQMMSQDAHIPALLGVAPLGKSTMPKECYYQLHHLTWASQHMPHPSDSDRLRNYLMRQPCSTPPYYPLTPPLDPAEMFQRLATETLFFIFYYMEGTKAQYLAAKALKKQSWRFHTKFMMWFQRHEEPKTITEDFEQGTYIYFDYERWSQRRKEGFTFEYRFLEDRDLN